MKRSLIGNFVVAGVGRGLSMAIGIGTVAVLFRYLGQLDYGTYLLAFVFLQTVTVIANFGFALGQLQLMGRGELDEARVVGGFVALRMIVGGLALALAPAIVLLFDYSPEVDELVAIGTIGFFFTYLGSAIGPIFQKHLIMGRASVAALVERTSFLVLVLGCVALELRTHGVMIALGVSGTIGYFLRVHMVQPFVATRPRIEPEVWKAAWTLGWPVAVLAVFNLVCMQGDLLLLGAFRDEAEVGLYGVPFRMLGLILSVLPITLMGLILPQLSRTWVGDHEEFHHYVQSAFDFLMVTLLPVVVATLARAEGIMVLLGGAELEPAGDVLRIMMLGGAVMFFTHLYGHVLMATEQTHRLIAPTAVVAVACSIVYLVFIPEFGVWAASWGRVFHAVLLVGATLFVLPAASRRAPRLGVSTRAGVAAAAMAGVLWVLPQVHVIVDLSIGSAVYALMSVVTGAVKPAQIRNTMASLRPRRVSA